MAIRPNSKVLSGTSVDVLNVIRNEASTDYKNYIPIATPDADVLKGIGAMLMQHSEIRNEFASRLCNRIGKVFIDNAYYTNPWARFKKGVLQLGESVEEICINIIKAEVYDPAVADQTVWRRRFPDVRAAFHIVNYEAKYPVTIGREDIRKAFVSESTLDTFIQGIYNAIINSAEYDEFNVMKYCIARRMLAGGFKNITVPLPTTKDNMESIVIAGKAASNHMTYYKPGFTLAGNFWKTDKDNQFIIINADFEAAMGVKILATAFHRDDADYEAHRASVDSFGEIDNARLADIFVDDPTFKPITPEEKEELDKIPFILVDERLFQVYDDLDAQFEIFNPDGIYTNIFYHVWRVVSTSPFVNAAAFIHSETAINAITISPNSAEYLPGMTLNLIAEVDATPFAERSVNWSIEGNTDEKTYIDNHGNLHIGADETGSINIIATAVNAPDVTGTAAITPAGSQPAPIEYSITAVNVEDGTPFTSFNEITLDGAAIELPANAEAGHLIYAIVADPHRIRGVQNADGEEIPAQKDADDLTCAFIIPNSNCTIYVQVD